ncbi:hypothetical protein AB0I22_04995 [Streptomyces sp. NPDC050610]|uniref:hypothetical protein n=1 Tax=Streptomyces sp. NPDC050610 TaxID=3157097 RepID=UPI003416862C
MHPRDIRIRRRCNSALAQLDPPRPFSVTALCDQLAEQRRRPIHLHPLPAHAAASGTCGMWLATEAADHIFFEQRTGRLHQEHIVLHELGHVLLDHYALGPDGDGAAGLLPDLDPKLIHRLLRRTNYTTPQEKEAETLAGLIRTRAEAAGRRLDGVLGNLQAAMGVRG